LKNIKKHIYFCIILLISLSISSQKAFASSSLKKVKYKYLITVPEDYDKDPGKKWPIIFYLHGRHASGKNLQSLKRYGLPYYISKGKKMDFIVVSPQCPWGKNWSSEDWFNPVYDEVAAKLRVDDCRVYLIGMSMGGFGTWSLANRMPDRFAAISPMCGAGDVKWADNLSKIPTWVFHGTADDQIPISRSEEMVKALKNKNANLKYSRLVKQGHDISKQFNNDELYTWLKQFSLKKGPFWQEPLPFLKIIAVKKMNVFPPERPALNFASIQDE
jgi:predicted peptidase